MFVSENPQRFAFISIFVLSRVNDINCLPRDDEKYKNPI